jgi:hypothetical protein
VGNAIVAMSAIDLLCVLAKQNHPPHEPGGVRSLHANPVALFGADFRPTEQAHEKSTATFILRVCTSNK